MEQSVRRTKPLGELIRRKEGSRLTRTLGSLDLVALGIGAIIGTGIFVVTGVAAAQYAGPGLVVSFVLAGIAAGLAALVYAELASAIPIAGSAYTYSYAALGEFVAWIVGWNLMLEYMVALGAVAIGWGSYFTDMMRSVGFTLPRALVASPAEGGIVNLPGVLVTFLIAYLVFRGTKQSASVNRVIVFIKLAVILLFIILGIKYVNPANWRPFLPFGPSGIVQGAAIIFFAYIGFDAVATAAEETKKPQRDLPIGIIGSLAISTILYIGVTLVLTGLVPYSQLNTASPVATALLRVGIPFAGLIVSIGALAGISSVLVVMLYAQSRIFFAMARDGLLPPVFARVHPKYKTPYFSILIAGGVVALTAGFLPISIVAQLANIGTLTAFIITAVGVLILRKKRPDLPRPFKTPGTPVTPLVSIAVSLFLILNLPPLTWIRFAVWMAIGLIIYFVYSYRHSKLNVKEQSFNLRALVMAPVAKPIPERETTFVDPNDEKPFKVTPARKDKDS
ncbi:MAG: amino acid permease [Peptococcaceae bacterium]|nr:amino acid permease [Peptococcaceae bacterium]